MATASSRRGTRSDKPREIVVRLTVEQAKAAFWALEMAPSHPVLRVRSGGTMLPQVSQARDIFKRAVLES